MNQVRDIIRVNQVHQQGYTGKGIHIAIVDSGLSPHPDYRNRILGWYDALHSSPIPYDDSGHGSHVAGISAGDGSLSDGRYRGIAPEASLIGVKVLDHEGNGTIREIIKGLNWILRNQYYLDIRIVNISIGTNDPQKFDETSAFVQKVNQLWNSGIVVVAAAGNKGPGRYSISAPGNSRKIITVGSSDLPQPRQITHSGVGPTLACIRKPDIVAPGSHIISCARMMSDHSYPYYTKKSGTSMSTPIVSGAIALLLQKYPSLTPKEIKIRLKNSSTNLYLPHEKQGWGLINVSSFLS